MQKPKIAQSSSSLLLVLFFVVISQIKMADSSTTTSPGVVDSTSKPAVHIVYTERPQEEEPEIYHVRTLATVLGSEEAAKEALVYSYKAAASGFSARLTPEQVQQISQQPGVLQVIPSQTYQLHAGPGRLI